MKKLLALALITTSTFALAQRGGYGNYDRFDRYAPSQESLVIHVDEQLKGQNVIALKKKIKQQYGHIDLQNMKLDSVKLVAKSKKGHGEAVLVIGQAASYPVTVGGSPYSFDSSRPYTFSRVTLLNPSRDSQGKWQLETKGNIKVKKVVVLVSKKIKKKIKTVVIPMYGQQSRGQSSLKLKKLIKSQNPNIDLTQMELKKVTLVAKSKQGRGQATLVVGQSPSYPATVYGSQRGFHSSAPRTFSQVSLQNISGTSQGKWQIELQGNIKVQEIIVTMKKIGYVSSTPVVVTQPTRTGRGARGGRRN